MQKLIALNHDKDIHMLKLGCTLPNLGNVCPLKYTDAKFHSFKEEDKDPLEETREDVSCGPSIISTTWSSVWRNFH